MAFQYIHPDDSFHIPLSSHLFYFLKYLFNFFRLHILLSPSESGYLPVLSKNRCTPYQIYMDLIPADAVIIAVAINNEINEELKDLKSWTWQQYNKH